MAKNKEHKWGWGHEKRIPKGWWWERRESNARKVSQEENQKISIWGMQKRNSLGAEQIHLKVHK